MNYYIKKIKEIFHEMNHCKKITINNDNIIYVNDILNELDLETYVYNRSLLHMINNMDIKIYSFTCKPTKQRDININDIKEFIMNKYKNKIYNMTILNDYLIFDIPNKLKDSKYKYINIYINIFSENIKYDVYFSLLNLMLNINNNELSLINNVNEFNKNYFTNLDTK